MVREPLRKRLEILPLKAKRFPGFFPSAGRTKTRDSKFGAMIFRKGIKRGNFREVQLGQYHVNTERNPPARQSIYVPEDLLEGSTPSDRVIGSRPPSIQAHLEVEHFPSLAKFQNIVIQKSPVGADASDEILAVTCLEDRNKISSDKGLSASKIDLKDVIFAQLIDQSEALIEGELLLFSPSGSRKAMDAGKVALVCYLPGHIDWSG
jgi:hypothetical protein